MVFTIPEGALLLSTSKTFPKSGFSFSPASAMYSKHMAEARQKSFIRTERISAKIYLNRDQKVMLDSALADLYGLTTG
jgi:hypothetical protein